MKILSYQPFSLYSNGGGGRILRRLYNGREDEVTALVVLEAFTIPEKGEIDEEVIYATPATRKWMRWYLRDVIKLFRQKLLKSFTVVKVQKAAKKIPYDVIHTVQHGPFPAALCGPAFCNGKQLWVSFHDHYLTTHTSRHDANKLWNTAHRRLVISEAYGKDYQRLFGNKPYEIITDGVYAGEIQQPSQITEDPVTIYFAGLLHIGYVPLFKVLADALDNLSAQGYSFNLLLRATQQIDFLANRSFSVTYKPFSVDDNELKAELNSASILYLPIKFSDENFYKFSLSTKMIGYLGAAGAVLYHGPADSIACEVLKKADCAVCCTSIHANELAEAIKNLISNKMQLSQNANQLAVKDFDMNIIQQRFWQP